MLERPVQFVRGVGPRRAEGLAALGVHTVADLITHFPFRYEHQAQACAIDALRIDESATVLGRIRSLRRRGGFSRPSLLAVLEDGTGTCYVRWFHPGRFADRLAPGMELRVHGRVGEFNGLAVFTNPQFDRIDGAPAALDTEAARLIPVYPATAGLPSAAIARVIGQALPDALPHIPEPLSDAFRRERSLPLRRSAVQRMHEPTCERDIEVAHRRLAYDELLFMQLALQLRRLAHRRAETAVPLTCTPKIDRHIRARFPFTLTAAQDRAVAEITADLARRTPMNRLLQGDVGCGKTVVALHALLVAVAARQQGVIMAPTEILAEQHFRRIEQYLSGSRVRSALLVGGMKASARRALHRAITAGEVDLVVGTHALLEEDVTFRALGVVVVDEQHKFGVRQRATIRSKSQTPHYLVMTATPIPRTLSMTAFGDLDVSVIDALPPGRQPATTIAHGAADADAIWRDLRRRVQAGEQAYIVYPLIDESDALPLRAARAEAERLGKTVFAGLTVGLLHGRMKSDEKDEIMTRFAAGHIAVLVATTVIEVGIDVPNATIMVIEHAERLGLSQLHQLRGRVGRGTRAGLCVLLHEDKSRTAAARLDIICETTDGFRIAEEDLKIRGPGELLGTKQHGLPELKVADLIRDYDVLVMARRDAQQILGDDPTLSHERHEALRSAMLSYYADVLGFLDVG